MKRIIYTTETHEDILCMSNVRGKNIAVEEKKPFSFYFSGRNSSHSIRVKPIFNPDKMLASKAGVLKLSDDWAYTPGEDDTKISAKDIKDMKEFFKKYIVLFCMVWDEQLDDPTLQDYFEGRIGLQDLIEEISFYKDNTDKFESVTSVKDLERVCRENNFVNFYGN